MVERLLLPVALMLLLGAGGIFGGQGPRNELILPVLVNGYLTGTRHFQSTVRIVNLGGEAEVEFQAFRNDGTPVRIIRVLPVDTGETVVRLELPRFGVDEAVTLGVDFDGWARIRFPPEANIQASAEVAWIDGPVDPVPICHRPADQIVTSVLVRATAPATSWDLFGAIRPFRQTSVALVNPLEQPLSTYWSLISPDGTVVASDAVEIPALHRITRNLGALRGPGDAFVGTFRVGGGGALSVGVVHQLQPGVHFSTADVSGQTFACLAVLTPARNPAGGECVVFPSSCIPPGWEVVATCE